MRELTVDEVKARELAIMCRVRDFCEERGLTYYLAYGTLIGALRHQGFIPWDDDVDLIMFRGDYEVFMREFNRDRTDSLRARCPENDADYCHNMGKVIDESTLLLENNELTDRIGVYIDIFAFDYLPEDEAERKRFLRRQQFLRDQFRRCNEPLSAQKNPVKRLALRGYKRILRLISANRIARKMNQAALEATHGRRTAICGEMTSYMCRDRSIFRTEWFDEIITLPFEGEPFTAPKNYDPILRRSYDDYMLLPPEEARVYEHGFKAYQLDE